MQRMLPPPDMFSAAAAAVDDDTGDKRTNDDMRAPDHHTSVHRSRPRRQRPDPSNLQAPSTITFDPFAVFSTHSAAQQTVLNAGGPGDAQDLLQDPQPVARSLLVQHPDGTASSTASRYAAAAVCLGSAEHSFATMPSGPSMPSAQSETQPVRVERPVRSRQQMLQQAAQGPIQSLAKMPQGQTSAAKAQAVPVPPALSARDAAARHIWRPAASAEWPASSVHHGSPGNDDQSAHCAATPLHSNDVPISFMEEGSAHQNQHQWLAHGRPPDVAPGEPAQQDALADTMRLMRASPHQTAASSASTAALQVPSDTPLTEQRALHVVAGPQNNAAQGAEHGMLRQNAAPADKHAASRSAAAPAACQAASMPAVGAPELLRAAPSTGGQASASTAALLGITKPQVQCPLPVISMVRSMKQGLQMYLLQAVLAYAPGEAHSEHQPLLSTAQMSLTQLWHAPASAYALARMSAIVKPELRQVESHSFRHKVHTLLSDPASSVPAQIVSLFILLCIVVTTGAYCYASLPDVPDSGHTAVILDRIELITTIVFTVEYVLRLLTCTGFVRFIISPLNILDVVAILPWYIELLLQATGVGALCTLTYKACYMRLANCAILGLSTCMYEVAAVCPQRIIPYAMRSAWYTCSHGFCTQLLAAR